MRTGQHVAPSASADTFTAAGEVSNHHAKSAEQGRGAFRDDIDPNQSNQSREDA